MGGYVVYGALGSGSVPVEAAMTLMGLDYAVVEGATWTHDPEILARVEAVNPLKQIPAVVTPDGQTVTESAAILTWLADSHPDAGLAPALDDPRRAQFLRWMTFIPASIYSLYWIRDEPTRLVPPELADQVKTRTAERIADCWRMMESQLSPRRYLLGEQMTVLDLYVTVVSRWGPRRRRFCEVAPRMGEVVKRVDADPRLERFWAERFPFVEGWEG